MDGLGFCLVRGKISKALFGAAAGALLFFLYLAVAFSATLSWAPGGAYLFGLGPSCAVLLGAVEIVLIEFYQRRYPFALRAEYLIHAEFCGAGINLRALDTGNLLQSPGEFPLSSWPRKQQENELRYFRAGASFSPAHASGKRAPPSCPISSLSPPMAKAIPLRHIRTYRFSPSGYTALSGRI